MKVIECPFINQGNDINKVVTSTIRRLSAQIPRNKDDVREHLCECGFQKGKSMMTASPININI